MGLNEKGTVARGFPFREVRIGKIHRLLQIGRNNVLSHHIFFLSSFYSRSIKLFYVFKLFSHLKICFYQRHVRGTKIQAFYRMSNAYGYGQILLMQKGERIIEKYPITLRHV